MMRLELRELRESQREEERRISDESKLLYAEAFGSFNLGLGSAKSDSEVSSSKRIIIEILDILSRSTGSGLRRRATHS